MNEESRAALAVIAAGMFAIAALWWFSKGGTTSVNESRTTRDVSTATSEPVSPAPQTRVPKSQAPQSPKATQPTPSAKSFLMPEPTPTSAPLPTPEPVSRSQSIVIPEANTVSSSLVAKRRSGELQVQIKCPKELSANGGAMIVHVENGTDRTFRDVTLQNSVDSRHLEIGDLPEGCILHNDWGIAKAVCDLGELKPGDAVNLAIPVTGHAPGATGAKSTLLAWSDGNAIMRSATCVLQVRAD